MTKITWGIWTTLDKQWKVQKVSPAKTLHTEDIANITFNYLCENSLHSLIHYILFFETISHFSRHDSSLFFLAQTLHTFYKISSSKCKSSDFPLLVLKFTKFLMSFFKQQISFSSKFESLFSAIRYDSYVLFLLKLFMLLTKVVNQKENFRTCSCWH